MNQGTGSSIKLKGSLSDESTTLNVSEVLAWDGVLVETGLITCTVIEVDLAVETDIDYALYNKLLGQRAQSDNAQLEFST